MPSGQGRQARLPFLARRRLGERRNPLSPPTFIASTSRGHLEGSAVAPLSFGTFAGHILATDDVSEVWAISPAGVRPVPCNAS